MATHLPETHKIVCGSAVATTDGAIVGDYICLKTARKVTVIAHLLQTVGHATALGFNEATAVAPTGAQAGTAVMPVWKNTDISASDALVAGTDAATIAASSGAANQVLVMEILPERLTDGYDCVAATLTDSSQAGNFATITYLVETKYPQETPPSVITD